MCHDQICHISSKLTKHLDYAQRTTTKASYANADIRTITEGNQSQGAASWLCSLNLTMSWKSSKNRCALTSPDVSYYLLTSSHVAIWLLVGGLDCIYRTRVYLSGSRRKRYNLLDFVALLFTCIALCLRDSSLQRQEKSVNVTNVHNAHSPSNFLLIDR